MPTHKIAETIVGSQLFGYQRPDSDTDFFEIYFADTYDILTGKLFRAKHTKKDGNDYATYEIGQVIHEVMKGNINFICGVLGSWGHYLLYEATDTTCFNELKDILFANPAKNIYHSIAGISRDAIRKNDAKNLLRSYALLQFGMEYLFDIVRFDYDGPVQPTVEDVTAMLGRFVKAYNECDKPEDPPSEPYLDYLVKWRRNFDEY